ncbi:MAG: response regulator [Alphaproteobacteria bacterium]|nr:response regulator [Alphaproteobacteria bacterium]
MKKDPVHFLLVDDLQENILALQALLRRDGLVFLQANSGMDALELLLKHDVALALIDVQMPEMNGFELAELMRGTERTKNVPIIFLTAGNTDQQRRFRGYEAGAVDFLQKPIEPDILKSKANVFYELHKQRQEVARLLKESREYADALKEADKRKDEFLATLAHELRNPLAPIRNGLEILRRAPDAAKQKDVQDVMTRQLIHMVRLIDDLMDIARVSKGKIELRRERISVQNIINAALESSRPLIDAAGHTLLLDMPEAPVWVEGDLTRLAQAVGNILNNAAKYTKAGGKISLSVIIDDGIVDIRVGDNGIGIPHNMRDEIFHLFTQAQRTFQQSQGGLGIGLALVKHLVELHEGTITVESDGDNKGSVFTISLPAAATLESAVSEAAQESVKTPNAGGLRILVVDDNVPSAKTTAWMLEMIGHQTSMCHDGREALEYAEKFKPQVIFLDIGLPSMSGYEVCKALRQNPIFKEALIIAQTGWGQKRDRDLSEEAGFDHHLVKPINLQDVETLLQKKIAGTIL